MLDEFDVFMDMYNRRLVMEMFVDFSLDNPNSQSFFFTPQGVKELNRMEKSLTSSKTTNKFDFRPWRSSLWFATCAQHSTFASRSRHTCHREWRKWYVKEWMIITTTVYDSNIDSNTLTLPSVYQHFKFIVYLTSNVHLSD